MKLSDLLPTQYKCKPNDSRHIFKKIVSGFVSYLGDLRDKILIKSPIYQEKVMELQVYQARERELREQAEGLKLDLEGIETRKQELVKREAKQADLEAQVQTAERKARELEGMYQTEQRARQTWQGEAERLSELSKTLQSEIERRNHVISLLRASMIGRHGVIDSIYRLFDKHCYVLELDEKADSKTIQEYLQRAREEVNAQNSQYKKVVINLRKAKRLDYESGIEIANFALALFDDKKEVIVMRPHNIFQCKYLIKAGFSRESLV